MPEDSRHDSSQNERLLSTEDSRQLDMIARVVWKNRRSIARIVAIATVLSAMYVFIMPQSFTSTVSILPPQNEERSGGLADLLSGNTPLFDISATLGFGGRPSDIFVDILKSRTVAESVIVRHRLREHFGYPPDAAPGLVIEQLQTATQIESAKDGLVILTVTFSTGYFAGSASVTSVKKRAADVANAYVDALDLVNRQKLVSKAKNTRVYLERQIAQTRSDLDAAYSKLVTFQKTNRLMSLDKQLDGIIRAAAEIKARLVEAEAEVGFQQQDLKKSSRALREAQARASSIQEQYQNLLYGAEGQTSDYTVALNKLPDVGRELAGIVREVKVLEEVNAYLNRQFYKERVQEARDLPTVQVLDEAVPAHQRTSPKRALWIIVTLFVSAVVAAIIVLLREAILSARSKRTLPSHI